MKSGVDHAQPLTLKTTLQAYNFKKKFLATLLDNSYAMYEFVTMTTFPRFVNEWVRNYPTHLEEEFANCRKPPDGARIVLHNDESVREGYIRNGDKEVKLFTSALKAFQCNNRIVMEQRNHLENFLRGKIIGWLECGRTPTGSIRGTWNRPECHLQALATIARGW
ncbi:HTH_Tnp_Tc3_2 domain-containing protein [Trichonephila clavipes]|nr:HTH_Tnp_Tc3_2 domain-containing protein [Trichonephila clavipes]